MRQVKEMIKKQKDTTRMIVSDAEYQERLRKGLPLNTIVTFAELKRKYLDGKSWKRFEVLVDG